jgi:hypothetical protein
MSLGRFGLRGSRPLADLTAVQLVERTEFQVNLVLTGPGQLRLNLLTSEDQAGTRQTARQLAAFLNLPLQGGAAPCPSPSAESIFPALDSAPLPVGKMTLPSPPALVKRGSRCLVLKTRWLSRDRFFKGPAGAVLLLLAVMGMVFVVFLVFAAFGPGGRGLGAAARDFWAIAVDEVQQEGDWKQGKDLVRLALVLLLIAVWFIRGLFLDRIRFNHASGWMTAGCLGLRGKRRLSDIIAVQVVKGGVLHQSGKAPVLAYQINLALTDSNQPRLNLTHHADRTWTQEAGRRLAAFLLVPLVDEIVDG